MTPPFSQASFSRSLIADRIIQCVHSKWHWLLETLGFKIQAEIKGASFSPPFFLKLHNIFHPQVPNIIYTLKIPEFLAKNLPMNSGIMYPSPTKVSSLAYFPETKTSCVYSWTHTLTSLSVFSFLLNSLFQGLEQGSGVSLPLFLDNSVTLCRGLLLLLHHYPHLIDGYLSSRVLEKIKLGNVCKSLRKYCLNCFLINAKCCYCLKTCLPCLLTFTLLNCKWLLNPIMCQEMSYSL